MAQGMQQDVAVAHRNISRGRRREGSATVDEPNRNRRLAAMQHLQKLGQHFSDQAIKERSPLLFHEHVGQYMDQGDVWQAAAIANANACSAGGGPGAAMRLSDSLMAQHDAVLAHQKLLQEIQEDEVHKEFSEEEEEESEEEQEGVQGPGSTQPHGPTATAQQRQLPATLSVAALARKRQELMKEMENRFLQGLDPGIDYAAIDADKRLDEHWAAQITQDAEDAYFQEDEEGDPREDSLGERKEDCDY